MSEKDRLLRVRSGDRGALGALLDAESPAIHALVSRMLVGYPSLVDDVCQDVLLRVIGNLSRFDPEGPARLRTWILTIATRRCIDVLRRPRRAVPLDFDLPAAGSLPERSVEQRQLYERVVEAMAALSPEQRAVLILRAYHELSLEEIGAALSIEIGTVKSRLSRARAALRAATADEGGVP